MSSTEKAVLQHYQNGMEDTRATQSRYAALEFYYTQKHLAGHITPETAVLELGCGTGYYATCFAPMCREYVGVDISPENIALFKEKIRQQGLKNVHAHIGDATRLRGMPDKAFDVVLCLGPLYHLPPEERDCVLAECRRLCRDGGVAAFAYINKVGVYTGACVHDRLRAYYPSEQANKWVLSCGRDDVKPDLFFYTMPEEIEAAAEKYGFQKIKNLGTDFFITMSIIDAMDDEKFALLQPLLDQMTAYESCTGMSNHALLVCRA